MGYVKKGTRSFKARCALIGIHLAKGSASHSGAARVKLHAPLSLASSGSMMSLGSGLAFGGLLAYGAMRTSKDPNDFLFLLRTYTPARGSGSRPHPPSAQYSAYTQPSAQILGVDQV